MRSRITWTPTDDPDLAALRSALMTAGVAGPTADEGVRIEWRDVARELVIDADRDVTALVTDWMATATNRDAQARAVVVGTVQAILAKDPATRTAVERWMLAISWLTLRVGGEG